MRTDNNARGAVGVVLAVQTTLIWWRHGRSGQPSGGHLHHEFMDIPHTDTIRIIPLLGSSNNKDNERQRRQKPRCWCLHFAFHSHHYHVGHFTMKESLTVLCNYKDVAVCSLTPPSIRTLSPSPECRCCEADDSHCLLSHPPVAAVTVAVLAVTVVALAVGAACDYSQIITGRH